VIGDYKCSDGSLLGQILPKFASGDLSLLDRGLGGTKVYKESIGLRSMMRPLAKHDS